MIKYIVNLFNNLVNTVEGDDGIIDHPYAINAEGNELVALELFDEEIKNLSVNLNISKRLAIIHLMVAAEIDFAVRKEVTKFFWGFGLSEFIINQYTTEFLIQEAHHKLTENTKID